MVIFFSSYSEGGFATMAAHHSIEDKNYIGINLLLLLQQLEDSMGMLNYFIGLETYHEPYYIAYVAMGYKTSYDWGYH